MRDVEPGETVDAVREARLLSKVRARASVGTDLGPRAGVHVCVSAQTLLTLCNTRSTACCNIIWWKT